MSKFIGRRGSVGLAKESSAGTPVTPTVWLPVTSITFDDKTTTVVGEHGLGNIADSDDRFVTNKYGEGECEFELDDKAIGLILSSLIGASPSTGGGNPYTHTYTLANTNTHQTLSLAYQDPDGTKMFPYVVVDSLTITVEPEGIMMGKISFKSRVAKDWATLTPSYTSLGNKFLHQHLIFKLAAATGSLAAASNISLKKLELTISSNAQFDNVTGTVEPESVFNAQFSVEGSITLFKTDDTYRNYMLAGTYRAMEVTPSRSATNSQLQMQFPRVSLFEWEQDRALNDIVGQTINFKGHYDAANAAAIISTCILLNTTASGTY